MQLFALPPADIRQALTTGAQFQSHAMYVGYVVYVCE
jgi:hypothetical protein